MNRKRNCEHLFIAGKVTGQDVTMYCMPEKNPQRWKQFVNDVILQCVGELLRGEIDWYGGWVGRNWYFEGPIDGRFPSRWGVDAHILE